MNHVVVDSPFRRCSRLMSSLSLVEQRMVLTVGRGGEIELLVVGGGGGGGRGRGGGGGAGGLIYKERYTVGSRDFTVTVGVGG